MNFQAFLCYDVGLLNFMFLLNHPVWVEEEYKERKRTFQRVCEREKNNNTKTNKAQTKHKQPQNTNKNTFLDVITF